MTGLMPLVLILLTPVTIPVSGGRAADFRFLKGLVPLGGWTEVAGIPFASDSTFTEITFSGGGESSFRVLSSGKTAGMHPSAGSMVRNDGHAGFLEVSGVSITLCDFDGYGVASSWKGTTLDYREDSGLLGEYRSRWILLAGGPDAFTAGISPGITENLRLGPAWCRDERGGYLRFQGRLSLGNLILESGGAVVDDRALHRTNAALSGGALTSRTVYDGDELFGTLGIEPLLVVQWPCWGVSTRLNTSPWSLLCLSHGQGGNFSGEVQLLIRGVTGGFTLTRDSRGGFNAGFTLGIVR